MRKRWLQLLDRVTRSHVLYRQPIADAPGQYRGACQSSANFWCLNGHVAISICSLGKLSTA